VLAEEVRRVARKGCRAVTMPELPHLQGLIAWECDYPHSDSVFPDVPEFVLNEMRQAGVSDPEIDKIT
jgi:hypothetical protein